MEQVKHPQTHTRSSINEALDRLEDSIKNLPKNRQEALKEELEEEEELENLMDEKRIYTIEEFSKLIQLSPLTIRRAIKAGKINVIRLGTGPKAQIRITKAEVDKILEKGM